MPFTKPFNFVDGTALEAGRINLNDRTLKDYVNQRIQDSDIADNSINTTEIQIGDYNPINNEYTFATGITAGQSDDIRGENRAYWASNLKRAQQNRAGSLIWTNLFKTGPELYLESTADVIITFGGTTVSQENEVNIKRYWDSQLRLGYRYNDSETVTFLNGTKALSFEETLPSQTSAGNHNPFGNISISQKPPNNNFEDTIGYACRRWVGWTQTLLNLPAGSYKFALYVDAKVEEGYSSARSFKAEVFYK